MKLKITIIFISTAIFMLIATLGFSQQFLTPVSTLTGEAVAVTKDGQRITGKISMAMMGPKGLMSFRIKDEETGETSRFKAEEVDSLRIKMDGWGKLATIADQTSNLQKLSSANFDEAAEREYIYYHQVQWPGKKKFRLVQLLNAGWHDQIQVYESGQKTASTSVGGINVAGGVAKSYVINYKGETMLIDSNKYQREHFNKLFGDCAELSNLDKNDTRWRFFANHVFVYTTECN